MMALFDPSTGQRLLGIAAGIGAFVPLLHLPILRQCIVRTEAVR
jgi:hypothetical protein